MKKHHLASEPVPAWGLPLAGALAGLLTRSAAMGVMEGPPATSLDARTLARALRGLQRHGIGGEAGVVLAPLMQDPPARLDAAAERRLTQQVGRLLEALEDSAAPAAEWPAMREVFGDEALGALLGVAPASLRRYAGAERATPPAVAARLHWLALVVADLAGAYNQFGIRRWFERARTQLGGRSPRQALGRDWSPDSPAAAEVRALAGALSGAHPLAA